jgi:hypothetical protein
MDVVEHAVGDDAVELPIAEGKRFEVADAGVQPACSRQLDHPR